MLRETSCRSQVFTNRKETPKRTLRKGMMLSLAMACNSLGAPVRDCKPAPTVDRKAPIKTTHFVGQQIIATINSPPMLSPNLREVRLRFFVIVHELLRFFVIVNKLLRFFLIVNKLVHFFVNEKVRYFVIVNALLRLFVIISELLRFFLIVNKSSRSLSPKKCVSLSLSMNSHLLSQEFLESIPPYKQSRTNIRFKPSCASFSF